MKYRLKVFHKLLHDGLHHHSVVVHGVLTHHDGALPIVTKGSHQTSLQTFPHFVRQEKQGGLKKSLSSQYLVLIVTDLNGKHEGDPLVVGGVRGVIFALHPIKVNDTFNVGLFRGEGTSSLSSQYISYLILRFDIRRSVNPTVILSNIGGNALELAAEQKS